jgi:phosphoglycerate dehydrogenase-like enzyme
MHERPVVLVTEGSAPKPLAWLAERAEVVEAAVGTPAFLEALPRAAGMVVRTYTRVDAELLSAAPRLKVVGRGGVGLENVDVPACRARGVAVVYTPDANTLAVGDLVFGAIVRLIRPWAEFSSQAYPPAEFKRLRNTLRGRQLDELTLGVLGMGRVGRRVGHVAALGFGMNVIYHDVAPVEDLICFPAQRVSPETLFRRADVLSIHTDMRDGNRHLVGRPQLALMKASAVLLNLARGELLDAAALAEALRSGKLAGAAIDVFDPEPPGPDFPLLGLPNVILTPHMAARTETAIENMSWVVRDVLGVIEGRPAQNPAP